MRYEGIQFFIPSNRLDSKGRRTHVDGWNEHIKAVNKGRQVGAARERENVALVADYARLAMNNDAYGGLKEMADVYVTFIERDMRRDVPNVFGGLKWVLDGLSRPRGSKRVGAGLIYDDSPKWVRVYPRVEYCADSPGVHIAVVPDAAAWECKLRGVRGRSLADILSTDNQLGDFADGLGTGW